MEDSRRGTALPYFSFPQCWTVRLIQGFRTTNNTAGASLDVWSWAHVQVFPRGNTAGWVASQGAAVYGGGPRRGNVTQGVQQRREKKGLALLTFQLPLDPGPQDTCSQLQEGKDSLPPPFYHAWHLVYAPAIEHASFFVLLFSFLVFFLPPLSLSNLVPQPRYWTWALNSESNESN